MLIHAFLKYKESELTKIKFILFDSSHNLISKHCISCSEDHKPQQGTYQAVKQTLNFINCHFKELDTARICSYNEVIIKQLNSEYRVKDAELSKLYTEVNKILSESDFDVEFSFKSKNTLDPLFKKYNL